MANPSEDAAGSQFERDRAKVAASLLPKLKRVLKHVPFAEDLLAAYYCALDRRTPFYVRATLLGALAYFVLPFDAIPDMIAGLGYTDDAAVLYAALRLVASSITDRHREAARAWLDETGEN
jgi:uncharacterized membrane protein YkvA (DUF1232 family)